MSSKAILPGIPWAVAALGINAIPAGMVLIGDQSAETAMILYFLENILFILLTAARVRILAPAQDAAYSHAPPDHTQVKVNDRIVYQGHSPRDRSTLLRGYLLFSLSFSVGTGVFLFVFLFLILGADISRTAIMAGMAGIATFQILHFVADLLLLGPLSPGQAEGLLELSMGRVALLYVAVGVGAVLAVVVEQWFVLPFALLKTIADLAMPVRALGAGNQHPTIG